MGTNTAKPRDDIDRWQWKAYHLLALERTPGDLFLVEFDQRPVPGEPTRLVADGDGFDVNDETDGALWLGSSAKPDDVAAQSDYPLDFLLRLGRQIRGHPPGAFQRCLRPPPSTRRARET